MPSLAIPQGSADSHAHRIQCGVRTKALQTFKHHTTVCGCAATCFGGPKKSLPKVRSRYRIYSVPSRLLCTSAPASSSDTQFDGRQVGGPRQGRTLAAGSKGEQELRVGAHLSSSPHSAWGGAVTMPRRPGPRAPSGQRRPVGWPRRRGAAPFKSQRGRRTACRAQNRRRS